ncbi:MAG: hypothetical protein O9346_04305 [Leptospiraceae bacterium]|jgi:hypothetical protein|nr:hypothetical protein [Leptospiraceae bacterium]MCZ8345618.1 hypothetical protein [Leptospiraceae bacterium]PJE01988.1 MAG: hypothetical protein CK427_09305 [Leptospira sp.]
MKHLISVSILKTLLSSNSDSNALYKRLESYIQNNHKLYSTALSIFEIIQGKTFANEKDQKEYLNQSGILYDEIFPVTNDDLKLYSQISQDLGGEGLEGIEICVAINKNMDSLITWKGQTKPSKWMKVIDLSSEL